MPLTVLTDSDVRSLLLSLTRSDILDLQQSLADALHYYSTAVEDDDNGCCSSNQPMRTSLKRKNGPTTLFMPASSNDSLGVKIVTLAEPSKDGQLPSVSSLSLASSSNDDSPAPSTTGSFEPPESLASAQSTTPRGSLTLFDKMGTPRALINAEELTAFRTALASTMLLKKRSNVHDLCVFGAGKQAYWHIRLALILRGSEIHHVNIINRTFETAQGLMARLYSELPHIRETKVSILTPTHQEYSRLLKATVRQASIIFLTTPSLSPLFPAAYLTNPEGRKKGRYIVAIGSYKPHMIELHPDVIRQAVAPDHGHHFHRHAKTGGAIIVDSVESCLKEAGEVIQAGLTGREVVEIGELVMLKRDAEERRRKEIEAASSSVSSLDETGVELVESRRSKDEPTSPKDPAAQGLKEWLERGNVIYKSVGLGLMDVVTGGDLVRLADEKSIGTRIDNF